MALENSMSLKIVSPERVFYEGEVSMCEFNTTEGYIGVLPGHIPLTVIIAPGVLNIYEKDGTKTAALHSGFVEILPESVTILAEIVEWPDEINKERAMDALGRAKERLEKKAADTDVARAETALKRAIARIEVLK